MTDLARQPRICCGSFRLLLAVVVLLVRLLAPAMPMASEPQHSNETTLAALLDGSAICHAFAPDDTPRPADHRPPHHEQDCAFCPACHVLSAPVLPLLAQTLLPPKTTWDVRIAADTLPPPTGPPSRSWTPSRPRGPPAIRI